MEASKNDRLVKKFAALEDNTWFPQELLELVKDVCRLQSEVRASLAVSVDPALVCGDMEHRQGAPLLAREQFPVDAEGAEKLFRSILEVAESLPQLRTTAQLVRDKLIRGDIRPEELFRAYMLENAEPFEAWAKEAPTRPICAVPCVQQPWSRGSKPRARRFPPPIRRTTFGSTGTVRYAGARLSSGI